MSRHLGHKNETNVGDNTTVILWEMLQKEEANVISAQQKVVYWATIADQRKSKVDKLRTVLKILEVKSDERKESWVSQ